jgi:hypothetical protein
MVRTIRCTTRYYVTYSSAPYLYVLYVGVHADDDNLLTPLVGVPYVSDDIAQSVYV